MGKRYLWDPSSDSDDEIHLKWKIEKLKKKRRRRNYDDDDSLGGEGSRKTSKRYNSPSPPTISYNLESSENDISHKEVKVPEVVFLEKSSSSVKNWQREFFIKCICRGCTSLVGQRLAGYFEKGMRDFIEEYRNNKIPLTKELHVNDCPKIKRVKQLQLNLIQRGMRS
nr:unnamed protein product [Callosobruchus analis]